MTAPTLCSWRTSLASLMSLASFTALAALASCAHATVPATVLATGATRGASPWPVPGSVADSVHTERVSDGVTLHRLVRTNGPLRAYVLDVDLRACLSVRSVKGAPVAVGRQTTSALMLGMRPAFAPIAAVNADFFLFTPPGIPVGAHVEDGRLVSGPVMLPVARPVFAMLPTGAPWIGDLTTNALIRAYGGWSSMVGWNRPGADLPGIVDAAWGVALDSTVTGQVWRFAPVTTPVRGDSARYIMSVLRHTAPRIARGDTLLGTSDPELAMIASPGDTVQITRTMTPRVTHAVGGLPVLLRDSIIVGAVDSVNNAAFRGVNPRTAVGIGANGRRLLFVVIDGRRPGVSVGASLRETAMLLRALGARDAINLDGGGSSAMVLADSREARGVRMVNMPSDSAGERPVANALAVVRGCDRRAAADAPGRSLARSHITR